MAVLGVHSRRGLKICCCCSALFLVILTVVLLTLSLTIFKPKQPQISTHPIGLEKIQFNTSSGNVTLDVELSLLVTIYNPNYGGFEYKDSIAYVSYRGSTVAEVPIVHNLIPARSKVNITTSADLMADRLISNPGFWNDVEAGCLSLTSEAAFHGKVRVVKILKFHATAYSTCYISFHILSQAVETKCVSRIKV